MNNRIEVNPCVFPQEESDCFPSKFVRTFSNSILDSQSSLCSGIPSFLIFRPLAPNVSVPRIKCRDSIPRCGNCKSYLSPFISVNVQSRFWRCPVCGGKNSLIHFSPLYDFKVVYDRKEMHEIVYDIVISNDKSIKCSRSFIFVIDENLLISKTNSKEKMIECIKSIKSVIKPNDKICCILFSSIITIVNFKRKCLKSFVDCDISFCKQDDSFFVNAEDALEILIGILENVFIKEERNAIPFTAVMWGCKLIGKKGGKMILFSSGRCSERIEPMHKVLLENAISLNIFRYAPILELEKCAEQTGGVSRSFGQIDSLISLFTVSTAWNANSFLRISNGYEITKIMGPGSQALNEIYTYPILTSEQSVIYEFKQNSSSNNFFFQFAFRFFDDENNNFIRIINGKLPCTSIIQFPIDESALALYILRKKIYEPIETTFYSKISFLKDALPSSLPNFPILLYNGKFKSQNFMKSTCIERFAISVFPFKMILNNKAFEILYSSDMIIIYPEPNISEKELIKSSLRYFGFSELIFYTPANESEFQDMFNSSSSKESIQWYSLI